VNNELEWLRKGGVTGLKYINSKSSMSTIYAIILSYKRGKKEALCNVGTIFAIRHFSGETEENHKNLSQANLLSKIPFPISYYVMKATAVPVLN
jgi:hypothetical protein